MSNTYVAVSTDPIKSYEEIVEYAKEMQDKGRPFAFAMSWMANLSKSKT